MASSLNQLRKKPTYKEISERAYQSRIERGGEHPATSTIGYKPGAMQTKRSVTQVQERARLCGSPVPNPARTAIAQRRSFG